MNPPKPKKKPSAGSWSYPQLNQADTGDQATDESGVEWTKTVNGLWTDGLSTITTSALVAKMDSGI